MNSTLAALDREWTELDRQPGTATALRRWARTEPALAGMAVPSAILDARTNPSAAPPILAALARLAANDDELAARTLLQALLPGLVRMATTSCKDGPQSLDELVSLAWERIRTYPVTRHGSVAANVLLDVRKRYREHRAIDVPTSLGHEPGEDDAAPSAEDVVLSRAAVDHLLAAHHCGFISDLALLLIVRTRVDEVPLHVVAAEQQATARQANCIRWRAERRLRPVLAEAS